MSRRKQAKPRSLRKEDLDTAAFEDESGQDTLSLSDVKLSPVSPSTPYDASLISDDDQPEEGDDGSNCCSACGMVFESIPEYLEHLNEDCIGGAGGSTCGGSSARSSDTPDDVSLSPGGADTPTSELSFTVGVTESTPYGCQFCDKAFPRLSYLKRHEQVHGDQMPFRCDWCQRLFKHKRSRDRHVKLHTGDRKYRCGQCESAFSRSDHLKIHMRTHDNGKPHQCAVCNRGYNTAAALSSHMQNHKTPAAETQVDKSDSPDDATKLTVCPSPKDNLHPRSSLSSSSPLSSPRTLLNESSPTTLLKKCEGGMSDTFSCGFCSKSDFPSLESLQLHMQVLHLSPPPLHAFFQQHPATAETLLSYSGLNCEPGAFLGLLQKNQDGRGGDTYCSQCNLSFTSSTALLEHVQVVHEPPTTTSHSFLGKRYLNNSKARPNGLKHLKTSSILGSQSSVYNGTNSSHYKRQDPGGGTPNLHSVPRPDDSTLLCSQCGAAFPDFESFRTHLKSHLDAAAGSQPRSSSPPHSCPRCPAQLPNRSQLESHAVTHYMTSRTEYGCPACLQLFHRQVDQQRHLLDVHTQRLYRCALCRQVFDSKASIQIHLSAKHSSECRTFHCTDCSTIFRTEIELQRHVSLNHLSPRNVPNGYRCLLCDKLFSDETQLRTHATQHSKQFACTVCGERFHVEFQLDQHVQIIHQGGTARVHPGEEAQDLCTKKAVNGTEGRGEPSASPIASPVVNEKPTLPVNFRCEVCDITFPTEGGLSAHRRQVHRSCKDAKTGSNPGAVSLFCAYCSESCRSRGDLESHMKEAHTATPSKHKCNICDEICPSATTLAEHKLMHCKVLSGSMCVVCRVHLSNEEEFMNHIQQHNSTNGSNNLPVPCVVCRQTLVVEVEVRMHAKFHLKSSIPFELPTGASSSTPAPCCVCSRVFDPGHLVLRASGKDLLTYMCKECFHSRSDGEGSRCSDCGVKFETFGDLETHRRMVHQKKSYQCIQCQVGFDTEVEIQAHVANHVLKEGTHHECKLCHEVMTTPAKLQCHLIEHTFEGSSHFTCYLCASVFTSSARLQRHMSEQHGSEVRPYDCLRCPQSFFFRAELEHHSFSHLWESPNSIKGSTAHEILENSKCPSVFGNSSELSTQHHRTQSLDLKFKQETVPATCPICRMDLPSSEELKSHVILQHPSSIHLLNALSQNSSSSQDLYQFDEGEKRNSVTNQRHNKAKKSFECPICKKTFTRKENKKLHMRSHNQNAVGKSSTCSLCDKVFTKRSQMKEHMQTHGTTPNHTCEICDEFYASSGLLKIHLRDNHGRKFQHSCIHCNEPFDDELQMAKHARQVHPDDDDSTRIDTDMLVPKVEVTSSPPSPSTDELPAGPETTDSQTLMIANDIKMSDSVKFPDVDGRTNMPTEVVA